MSIPKPSCSWLESFKLREKGERASRVDAEREMREEKNWRNVYENKPIKHWKSRRQGIPTGSGID